MSSKQADELFSAEARFRQAFERLKARQPKLMPPSTPVTQNNVAREASCDPSALKKARFPALVREIQAFVELHQPAHLSATEKAARKVATRRTTEKLAADAIRQRDMSQSLLVGANARIVELTEEVQLLRRRLDEYEVSPVKLGRR